MSSISHPDSKNGLVELWRADTPVTIPSEFAVTFADERPLGITRMVRVKIKICIRAYYFYQSGNLFDGLFGGLILVYADFFSHADGVWFDRQPILHTLDMIGVPDANPQEIIAKASKIHQEELPHYEIMAKSWLATIYQGIKNHE